MFNLNATEQDKFKQDPIISGFSPQKLQNDSLSNSLEDDDVEMLDRPTNIKTNMMGNDIFPQIAPPFRMVSMDQKLAPSNSKLAQARKKRISSIETQKQALSRDQYKLDNANFELGSA